jgi:hypothetical protein
MLYIKETTTKDNTVTARVCHVPDTPIYNKKEQVKIENATKKITSQQMKNKKEQEKLGQKSHNCIESKNIQRN